MSVAKAPLDSRAPGSTKMYTSAARSRRKAKSTAKKPSGKRRHGAGMEGGDLSPSHPGVGLGGDVSGIELQFDETDFDIGAGGTTDERLVWALEKCRVMERDKIALLEKQRLVMDENEEYRREVKKYRSSNLDLKKLVAQLCEKLKLQQEENRRLKMIADDAEARRSKMAATYETIKNEAKQVSTRASSQHATFLQMTREAKHSKEQFIQAKQDFEVKLKLQQDRAAARIEKLQASIAQEQSNHAGTLKHGDDLRVQIARLEASVEAGRQRYSVLKEKNEQDRSGLVYRIKELEEQMVSNEKRMKTAVMHAEKVESTYAAKDQQVAEFAQLVETWEEERGELHRVLRQFEAKDEEQAVTIMGLRKQVHSMKSELHEIQRQRNLEHLAQVDTKDADTPRKVPKSPRAE